MNLTEFYPTPETLIVKMLSGLDADQINSVLEPSAGKGDIAEAVTALLQQGSYYGDEKSRNKIDCIELDENLRHILKGKKYRVVHDDFLNYQTGKRYDLIIMNPPFSAGDKHLSFRTTIFYNVRANIKRRSLKCSKTRKALSLKAD